MSPEQLEACNPIHHREADDLDGRSDVYSLGIVLWELLTGSRPFADCQPGSNWTATLDTMLSDRRQGVPVTAISQLPRDCPSGLKQILLSCLIVDRDSALTAAQLSRQLELVLEPQVMRAAAPCPGAWRNWIRRFPLTAMFAAGLLPNLIFTALNLAYNIPAIFESLGKSVYDVLDDPVVSVVNGAAFAVGIGIILPLTWPVAFAVSRIYRDEPAVTDHDPCWRRLRSHTCRCDGLCQRRGVVRDGIGLSLLAEPRGAGRQIPRQLGVHALYGVAGLVRNDGLDAGVFLRFRAGGPGFLSDALPGGSHRPVGARHGTPPATANVDLFRSGSRGAAVIDGGHGDHAGVCQREYAAVHIRHLRFGRPDKLRPGLCAPAECAKRPGRAGHRRQPARHARDGRKRQRVGFVLALEAVRVGRHKRCCRSHCFAASVTCRRHRPPLWRRHSS